MPPGPRFNDALSRIELTREIISRTEARLRSTHEVQEFIERRYEQRLKQPLSSSPPPVIEPLILSRELTR